MISLPLNKMLPRSLSVSTITLLLIVLVMTSIFYVGIPSTNIVDEELAITSNMNKNKMAREFSKTVGSKKSNRLLLTKLAEELAVA